MKTRNGFVSNSSSSSFIVILTEEAFEEALKRMKDERDVKVMRYMAKDDTVFGKKMKVFSEFTDAGGFSSIWGCDSDDEAGIIKAAGIEWPPVDKDGNELEEDEAEEWWYPKDSAFHFEGALDKMEIESQWKNQIYRTSVGDGG